MPLHPAEVSGRRSMTWSVTGPVERISALLTVTAFVAGSGVRIPTIRIVAGARPRLRAWGILLIARITRSSSIPVSRSRKTAKSCIRSLGDGVDWTTGYGWCYRTRNSYLQPFRVDQADGMSTNLGERIQPALQANRITLAVSPRGWVVVPAIVVMDRRFVVEVLTRESQSIAHNRN